MKSLTTVVFAFFALSLYAQSVEELGRFPAPNATQAVAVDSLYFYTISNAKIVKRRKVDGKVVKEWQGPLKHLNSGIVLDGKLYCANTNYPEVPMASSLEIFDTETLEHVDSHSFGLYAGSFTWIDRYQGDWYLMFVHYENQAQEQGKGVEYSTLIQMDSTFQRKAGWVLPKPLVERVRPYSISGGSFAEDGTLYLTHHHHEEIYRCRLPKMGYTLEWLDTMEVPIQGQGMAWDRSQPGVLYGIHRQNREVVRLRISSENSRGQER